jgi:DNA helicase HerA-like ATPase
MAESVLAECNSIFAMRMTNQSDQDMVRAAVSEAPLGLLEFLPSLRTGEAIAIGEGIPMPVRVSFDGLEAHELPRSETALFTTLEKGSAAGEDLVRVAVERWRSRQKAA